MSTSTVSIGEFAFGGCISLPVVRVPESVIYVGPWAFSSCSSLRTAYLGDHVNVINEGILAYCPELVHVTIPSSVTVISASAFRSCYSLESVDLPDSVEEIGSEAFFSCSSLMNVRIPDSVVEVQTHAFAGCTALSHVTIGSSLRVVGVAPFEGCCNITDVTSWSETKLDSVFDGCSRITNVTIAAGGGQKSMFENCDHIVTLSIQATEIVAEAWADCTSLQYLAIGDTVVYIGERAFKNCSQLPTISLDGSVTAIRDEAFRDCSSLSSVVLGSNLDYLGIDVFGGCHSLTAATIPSPLPRSIGDVFDCTIITSVTFLGSTTSVADEALKGCTSVASVHMFDNVTAIGADAFAQCSHLSAVTMSSRILSVGARAFLDCSRIVNLSLSDTIESIGWSAFQGCASLVHVEIPPNVDSIADFTFSGCSALQSLTVRGLGRRLDEEGSSRIQTIGEHGFYGCSRLKDLYIGDSLRAVGKSAFAGCSSLSSTPNLNGLTVLEDYVFANCTALVHVFIPDGVSAISQGAFSNCSSLQSVEWGIALDWEGNNTITIGKSAFGYCSSLRNLTIPASVIEIQEGAFQYSSLDWSTLSIHPREGRIIHDSAFPSSIDEFLPSSCKEGFEFTLNGCACYKGKMYEESSGTCRTCGEYFDCPGGHIVHRDLGIDKTVKVKEGYMTLDDDPFSVYTGCVHTVRCMGERHVLSSMCTAGFDSASARCAECLPELYLTDGRCEPCAEVTVILVVGKWLVSLVTQLVLNIAFYINVNSPKTASQGTIESLVEFIQIVQTLSRLDITAPPILDTFFTYLELLSIPGIFKTLDFKPECTFGSFGGTITYQMLQQTGTPLILFTNLALMQMLFVLCNRTLKRDFVHNLVCLVFSGLFVSLVTLSLSLFYTERMPNGKDMRIIAFPQLEYGSPSWTVYLPINLFATCAYGLTIYTYVAYTVFTAPRRIGTERGFIARYRFCFGTKRPDRWWWILVKMSFGLSLCLVQVVLPANNVHSHVYTSALFMFVITVILYGAWPWKFDSNNWVEVMCKIALIVLLMLTTAFIDVSSMPKSERDQMNNVWAHVIIFTLIGAFTFCFVLSGTVADL
ncbi:unnamed protein product [Prorocentrum cordatum]|uniref:Uncharacterized protein n=1 Tax=Prorocentrum cordatum TaxID=2364126 RepID=A0ABN9V9U7_9DINO|nr:unnamed protein product [Polarella glacialis]